MAEIILTTGGTGGHIFPALAVAEELRRRNPRRRLLFIGSDYGPEKRMAASAGIEFQGLPSRGFLGKGLKSIPAALGLGAALARAVYIVGRLRPRVVAGFGGYASFAPVLAAALWRRPILLHEQNAIAGASNRFLAAFAAKICVSLPNAKVFSRPCLFTGNPVRGGIGQGPEILRERQARKTGRLLVIGGSQGAHAFNVFLPEILDRLGNVEILHQTGERDFKATRAAYEKHGFSPECVTPFIGDMAGAYEWADLVFCRAGASTIAEICAAGLPAVLIPFPAAIHDHQTSNARILANAGAAVLVPERELDKEAVAGLIRGLLADPDRRRYMGTAALALAKPDAAALVADELEKLAGMNTFENAKTR